MSVRGGRGSERLWVAGALLLLLLPILPVVDAQSPSDPWWGPSDRARPTDGWAIRVPVVVENTYDYTLFDPFVAVDLDLGKLLVAAGWTNQSATAPRGFTLDVDSIRVVPYAAGFLSGPLNGPSTQPVPHRFYTAMFENPKHREFRATDPAGTVLFQVDGALRSQQKLFYYVYANPLEYTDTPAPRFDPLASSPLDAFMWGTRGNVYYGWEPAQVGQDHVVKLLATTFPTQVTVSTYELGRYVPVPSTAAYQNPFALTEERDIVIPAGKAFRIEADKPIVVASRGDADTKGVAETFGYVPGRSGSFADDSFTVYGWFNSGSTAFVRIVKASPGSVTVTSSTGDTRTLTAAQPFDSIRVTFDGWSTLVGTGKFLVSQQIRGDDQANPGTLPYHTHQVPAITGGPLGTDFFTFLQPLGTVSMCTDANASARLVDFDAGGGIQVYPEGTLPNAPPALLPGGEMCTEADLPRTLKPDNVHELYTTSEEEGVPAMPVSLLVDAGKRADGETNLTRPMVGSFYGGLGGVDYHVEGPTGIFGHYNGTRVTIFEEKLRDGVPVVTNTTLGLQRDEFKAIGVTPGPDSTGRYRIVSTKPVAAASLAEAIYQQPTGTNDVLTPNIPYARFLPGRPVTPSVTLGALEFRGPLVELRSPRVSGSQDFITTGPGSPVSYRLDVLNLGHWVANQALTDTIAVTCAAPTGWTVDGCNREVTLSSDAAERMDIVVTPSVDDVNVSRAIEIQARSKSGGAVASFKLQVRVEVVYGVGMWFDVEGGRKTIDPPIGLDPGETYAYTLVVKNTGSTTDTVSFKTDEVQEGWTQELRLDGVPVTSVRLDGGESRNLQFVVQAPDLETARPNLVSIVGQSQSSALAADVVNTATRIKPKVDLDLTLAPQTRLAAPNETAVFNLTLCNKGNDIFTIYLRQDSILPKGWTANFSTDRIGNELTLNRNPGCANPIENVTVQLFVTPPEGARAGDLASAKIAAEIDTGGAGGRVAGDEVSAVVVVRRVYDLATPNMQDVVALPGATLPVSLPLRNVGNGQVDLELLHGAVEAALLSPDGTETVVPDWRVELQANDEITLELNDTVELPLRISVPKGTPPGLYNLTFTTRLSREALQNLTIPVDVKELARVDLVGPESVAFTPGRPVTLAYVAENTGNYEGAFDLAASAPTGWNATISPARVRLAPGDRADVTLTLNATRDAADATHVVQLTTAAEGRAPTTRDLSVRTARPQLRLEDVGATGALRPGELVLVTATVANGGGIAAENLSVALVVDDRIVDKVTLSRIPVGTSALATLSWVSTQRGGDVRVVVDPDEELALAARGADETEAVVEFGSILGVPGPSLGLVAVALLAGVALRRRWGL